MNFLASSACVFPFLEVPIAKSRALDKAIIDETNGATHFSHPVPPKEKAVAADAPPTAAIVTVREFHVS